MRRVISLVSLVCITLFIAGCGKKSEKVLAKVGEKVITLEEFNERINKLPKQYQEIIKGQKKKFLEDVILEELLYEEALRSGAYKDPETKEVIAQAKKKILISWLVNDRVNNKVSVSEEDLKKYYDEHSEEFMLPERWRASHILVYTPEEAQEIKEKLESK